MTEIKIVSFNFAPKGWALCNGQLLPINQNQPLFALIGTTFGGNGQTTFGLPNLQGCVAMHNGNGHTLGEKAGSTSVTLNQQQMPAHTHTVLASDANGTQPVPTGNVLAQVNNLYTPPVNLTALDPSSVSNVGGSQPHNNMMPYLVLNFIIALQGIFPSRN
jgi:microcystin-dependent protein